ncbi:beta-ketoacyl-[acyl-carrier-protein] synthase family protein [Nocardiopsis sp. RSe5-2]|uniref:Beta-ketoacyl-[acyl-carrier-protein] synthase family protein n=1 Tax=Nocardiopsis endophytica TaxID=3018445 RepID=A0ABT4U8G0_9ACTN|nr:beta-ketoacyl-[acyl-carrier-protein] synthase family protein [Nocardiopsis endophytica]MDA2813006.1 beta-ketoacyl-[acyl-carrier-protein] synthase family protein [Nocardiopsis endophytica]
MRRIAVTGIGAVAPGEPGRERFWDRMVEGRPATRGVTLFDASQMRSRVAAECDFDPIACGLTPQEVRRNDRFGQFALVASAEALDDAGLGRDDLDGERTGVCLGSAVGATMRLEEEYVAVSDGGRHWEVDGSYAGPFMYPVFVPSSIVSEVAVKFGANGPASLVSTGCTSGIDAVGQGARMIADGEADVVIAGGTESPISPISYACFDAIRATTPANDRPAEASRPFDADRQGFVMGEGCAVLVLEDLDRARARGAHVYCTVAGYASRANAYHMTGLHPDGVELAEAVARAMDEARVDPGDIGYVNAHGSGTVQNDRHETGAYKRALGPAAYDVPVSSIKSMIGHSLGAIGALETAACALAIDRGVLPPTANLTTPDPECDLDYIPGEAREARVGHVLSAGSGFGGFQSAVVLSRT